MMCEKCSDLENEANIMTHLIQRQEQILCGVANALKGEPKPLHCHDHSDMVEVAKAVMEKLRRYNP